MCSKLGHFILDSVVPKKCPTFTITMSRPVENQNIRLMPKTYYA